MTETAQSFHTINREYKEIPVELLHPHPFNPNQGDMGAIAESVEVNGFYGAVTVRDSPVADGQYEIVAGEHRWRTAMEAGAATVPCIVIEAGDVEAARILLADNETAKRSTYRPDVLTEVLAQIGDIRGTGFELSDLGTFEDERAAAEPAEEPESNYEREYGIVVYAEDEARQEQIYEKLRAEGYRVRVASI